MAEVLMELNSTAEVKHESAIKRAPSSIPHWFETSASAENMSHQGFWRTFACSSRGSRKTFRFRAPSAAATTRAAERMTATPFIARGSGRSRRARAFGSGK